MEFSDLKIVVFNAKEALLAQRAMLTMMMDTYTVIMAATATIQDELESPQAESANQIAHQSGEHISRLIAENVNAYDFLNEIYQIMDSL